MTMVSYQRTLKGKSYYLYDLCFTREEANLEARELRSAGWQVRVLPAKDGYFNIYRRR